MILYVNIHVCFLQVTDSPRVVLSHEASEDNLSNDLMINHVRRLVKERDSYLQQWLNASVQERVDSGVTPSSPSPMQSDSQRRQASQVSGSETHHFAVELADWKSRVRKQRQEL